MPKLYIQEGANQGSSFNLPPFSELIVGRSSTCDIKLKDLDASRKHAKLSIGGDGSVLIEDLGSKNGTFLNGQKITTAKAQINDQLRIGNTICTILSDASSTPLPQPISQPYPDQLSLKETARNPAVQPHIDSRVSTRSHRPTTPQGWEKIEGGATIVNLSTAANPLGKSISNLLSTEQPSAPEGMDATVHTMLDLNTSSTLIRVKETEDIEVLKRSHKFLSILYEVANTITSNLKLETVLQNIMKLVFKVFRPDRGFILLFNDKTNQLEPKVYLTKEGQSNKQLTFSRSIIRKAIQEESAILCSDASQDERFSGTQSIINFNIRSAMCVPLKPLNVESGKSKVLGILQVDNRLASGNFKQEDLELLTSICNMASVAISNAKLYDNIKVETERRTNFERFLSPNVVEQVMQGKVDLHEAGGEEVVTIFFSDIRSFTTLSEGLSPQELVAQLNEYFSEMTKCIFDYQGTIDKFIGDAVMSVFGPPYYPKPDHPIMAVRAAIAQQKRLVELNKKWESEGRPRFDVGIGINTGKVMVGNIGSERRMEFTVIGDHVNIASRLCGKAAGGEIVISEFNYPMISQYFPCEEMEPVPLKGKTKPVKLYRVLY
ncbi:MAG: FHA domain-containing protein [Planctomycetota bacterium]|nr:MAG: FHA domain-containing protein [Planctomycetota bacterium]